MQRSLGDLRQKQPVAAACICRAGTHATHTPPNRPPSTRKHTPLTACSTSTRPSCAASTPGWPAEGSSSAAPPPAERRALHAAISCFSSGVGARDCSAMHTGALRIPAVPGNTSKEVRWVREAELRARTLCRHQQTRCCHSCLSKCTAIAAVVHHPASGKLGNAEQRKRNPHTSPCCPRPRADAPAAPPPAGSACPAARPPAAGRRSGGRRRRGPPPPCGGERPRSELPPGFHTAYRPQPWHGSRAAGGMQRCLPARRAALIVVLPTQQHTAAVAASQPDTHTRKHVTS